MALARVQSTGKVTADSAASIALTFPSPPTVGNAIVVMVSTFFTGGTATTCVDNRGNSYTLAHRTNFTPVEARIYYCPIITASSAPFTITVAFPTSTGYLLATAIEISGVGTGLAIDRTIGTTSGSSSTPATGASAALTVNEVFLASCFSFNSNALSITVEVVSPTWTEEYEELNYALHAVGEADSRIKTGASGTTASCSWTCGTASAWSAALVAFKATTTDARLSQLPVEVAILSDAPILARLSQLPIEILIDTSIIPSTSTETTQFLIVMP